MVTTGQPLLNDHLPVVQYPTSPEGPTMNDMSPEPQHVSAFTLPAHLRKRLEEARAKGSEDPVPDPWLESPEDRLARKAIQANNRSARWRERLPRNYATASLDDLTPAQQQVIRRWIADQEVLTLALVGPVGTGKTHAAYAIGNYAVERGSWVEAYNVHDLLVAMRPGGDPSAYDRATRARLLVLDDLGTADPSPWAKDELLALVNHRVGQRLRTIITTNVDSVGLKEVWDQRMVDRLVEDSTSLVFAGESRRKAAW